MREGNRVGGGFLRLISSPGALSSLALLGTGPGRTWYDAGSRGDREEQLEHSGSQNHLPKHETRILSPLVQLVAVKVVE